MIKIAIRLDDITEDMDWQKFLKFKGLLDLYGIKVLLGVVPVNEDNLLKISYDDAPVDFGEYIIDLIEEGHSIAMHGVNHIYTTKKGGLFPLNNFSEFAGLSYDEQYELLSYGVDTFNLMGLDTDIFMAPGHSFDDNTLKALKELGFKNITDGFGYAPYTYKNMNFYPISFKRSSTLNKGNGYSTLVYHVNMMNDKDFDDFEKMLKNSINAGANSNYELINYSDYLKCEPVIRKKNEYIKEYMMAKFKHILVKIASK